MYVDSNLDANPFVQLSKDKDKRMGYPIFGKYENNFNGLGITIHEPTGHSFSVSDYKADSNNYSGVMHFEIWDNFRLDDGDFGFTSAIPGMRSWYILQHYDEYGGKYKPFKTVVKFNVPFSGTLK